jgi:hypothetical protein
MADASSVSIRETRRVQPWSRDRRFWQYQGHPTLLLGASDEDNLFNHPDLPPDGLAAHLDRLVAAGGNYVRNTMSSRDPGNVWPFARAEGADGHRYDLNQPDPDYWRRFDRFLEMTAQRGIVVQIEVWDRFDFAREPWQDNPFNPKNNVNDTAAASGLPERIDSHPVQCENPFFHSPPALEDNEWIRPYQEAHVRRLLDHSLGCDHVLYCISNETNDAEAWSRYWAMYIRNEASRRGVGVELTEMWDAWDLRAAEHARTYEHPEWYSFIDASQNSQQVGQAQWDNLQWLRQRVADLPRPINSVKLYGGRHGGGPVEGQHKLWRHVLGGGASARYHRPGGGMGLTEVTAAHLRSLRMVLDAFDIFAATPANHLLHDRADDAAYLSAIPGKAYALYCPRPTSLTLDLADSPGRFALRWLDVLNSAWEATVTITGGQAVALETPAGEGPWAAVLARV